MAEVAGVLLDEVGQDPTQVDLLALAQPPDGYSEVRPRRRVGTGGGQLGLIPRDVGRRRYGIDVVEVTVLADRVQ